MRPLDDSVHTVAVGPSRACACHCFTFIAGRTKDMIHLFLMQGFDVKSSHQISRLPFAGMAHYVLRERCLCRDGFNFKHSPLAKCRLPCRLRDPIFWLLQTTRATSSNNSTRHLAGDCRTCPSILYHVCIFLREFMQYQPN